ncbi:27879_t:CDS:1, partial [Racocetra persica]
WVLATWSKIDPEIIQRVFCKCSISNMIDKSEDNKIYQDEILSNESEEIYQNKSAIFLINIILLQSILVMMKQTMMQLLRKNAIIKKDAVIEKDEEVLVFTID